MEDGPFLWASHSITVKGSTLGEVSWWRGIQYESKKGKTCTHFKYGTYSPPSRASRACTARPRHQHGCCETHGAESRGGGRPDASPTPVQNLFGDPLWNFGNFGGRAPTHEKLFAFTIYCEIFFLKCCFGIFAKCSSRNPRRTLNLGEGAQDSSLSPPSRESSWRRHLRNKYLTIIDGGFIYTSVSRGRGHLGSRPYTLTWPISHTLHSTQTDHRSQIFKISLLKIDQIWPIWWSN